MSKVKNTLLCCFSQQITGIFSFFEWHMKYDNLALIKHRRWCTKWSCQTEPLFNNTSHKSHCHILTVLRLFVELWSPNVLRQHLCFHFQFHRLQRPIWRLSEAIVSLCMQIFQLFTLLLWVSSMHLVACMRACKQFILKMWIISFTRMIKRWAAVQLCVFKVETVQKGLIFNVKCSVIPFAGPLEINAARRALKFIYSPNKLWLYR